MNTQDIDWLRATFAEKGFFQKLSDHDLNRLIDHMNRRNFAAGDVLIRQGDPGEWFYIVHSGKVDVTQKRFLIGSKKLADFGPKDIFGEMALVSNRSRTATIVASEDTVCFCMYKNQFQDMVATCPEFKQEIERLISLRT